MGKNFLLYATDSFNDDLSCAILEEFASFKRETPKEASFVYPAAMSGRLQKKVGTSIAVSEETVGDFSAKTIVEHAGMYNSPVIAARFESERNRYLAEKLLHISPIPVFFIKGDALPRPLLDHVIYATDWRTFSPEALNFILRHGEHIRELEIIHVINQKLTVKDMRQLKDRLQETRKVCLDAGIDAEAHIYAGEVAEEILTAARDYRGTAIVMEEQQRRILMQRLFKKSASSEVIQDSTIPVAVIPSKNPRQ